MSRRIKPLAERFWAKVDKSAECWNWTGGTAEGYGVIRTAPPERKQVGAHRVSYEMAYGPIPAGLTIDHRCHNRACVNPAHLRAVTNKQNQEHRTGPNRSSKSGYLGVDELPSGRWRGRVRHHGKVHRTPLFDTPEEAAEAVKALRLSLFQFNDNDRRNPNAADAA